MQIRHVLFDADGVLQFIPGGLQAGLEPLMGSRALSFAEEPWHSETAFLVGAADYPSRLADALSRVGSAASADEAYRAMWERIEPVEEVIGLVHSLRSAGYGVHLATNQERRRAHFMRTALAYDLLFDTSHYSCDLGVAKPNPAFFEAVATRIGADPKELFFIDDNPANVDSASCSGLRTGRWHFEDEVAALHAILTEHGVDLCSTASPAP